MEMNTKECNIDDIKEMYGKFLKELENNTSEEKQDHIADQIEQLVAKITVLKNTL